MKLRFARLVSAILGAALVLVAAPSSVTLTASPNPATFGQLVTLTATVVPAAATGKATFYDGVTMLGIQSIASGRAILTTSLLASGSHSLKAYYSGDGNYAAGISLSLAQKVAAVPAFGFRRELDFAIGSFVLLTGDFNRDGKTDFVSGTNSYVQVALGIGNGTFQPTKSIYTGTSLLGGDLSLASGDFNGDGNADVVVCDFDANTFNIIFGNGDGSFQTPIAYPAVGGPASVAVGDFNGDGKADIVLINNRSSNVSVLLGRGDGTFQSPVSYAPSNLGFIAVMDFDGDGNPDLVFNGSILLGNGDGTFRPGADFATVNGRAAIADLNGDGKADLAVAVLSGGVYVLLGNGNGTFGTPVFYPPSPVYVQTGVPPLTIGDINGDGTPDILLGGANPGFLPGNGDGTFQRYVSLGTIEGFAVALADLNADGRADILVGAPGGIAAIPGAGPIQLAFTAPPADTVVGAAMPVVSVQEQDANANQVTGYASIPITLTSSYPGVNLTATTSYGGASFSNIVFSTIGMYTFTASSPGFAPVTSTPFRIANTVPMLAIETPAETALLAPGNITISGWAVDATPGVPTTISTVKISVDGIYTGNATYGTSRPDICAAYLGRTGCPNVGFSYPLNIASGTHVITATVADSGGASSSASVYVTVSAPLARSAAGYFRKNKAFLEDSNGNRAYDTGVDRFIFSFTDPNGTLLPTDVPVVGDWTGDGHAKLGIYRPTTGQWFLDANNNGVYDAGDLTYNFGGVANDVPVVGDWTGVGKSCVGVFRQGFFWILDLNCNGSYDGTPKDAAFPFGGIAGDVPVVGAWTGAATRVGVVRKYAPAGVPQGEPFFWVPDYGAANAGSSADNHHPDYSRCFAFGGLPGDVFLTGDWFGAGTSSAAVYRNGLWVLDAALPGDPQASHGTGVTFNYGGVAGDVPLVGKW